MPLSQNTIRLKANAIRGRMLTLPGKIGDTAVLFSKQRFAQGNWIGNNVVYWQKRKRITKWGVTPRNKGRALLVDTGRLRRSIRIIYTTSTSVTIGTDVPYAKAHNDGFRGEVMQRVSAHERRITKLGIVKTTTLKKRSNIKFGRITTGKTTVKAHERKISMSIPRRRFIGQSPYLDKQINRIIASEIMKATKQ